MEPPRPLGRFTLYVLHFTTIYKDSFFRNFGPENPKNMVINNQS